MTADETSAAATPAGSPSAAGPGPEPAAAAGSGPGTLIREARLKARFSIEELAAQTKLNRATLEALERDDFGALLEPVYVRGYYRKCAKVLTLSEAELLARYEKLQAPRQIAPPTKLRLASGGELGGDSSVPRLFIAASAVLAVAVTLFIWLAKPQGSTPAVSDPAPVTVPAAGPTGEAAVEAPAPAVEPPASGLSPGGEGPGTTLPAEAPASAAGSEAAGVETPAPAAAAPTSGALLLLFEATSWVRIEDSRNQVLLSGVMPAGSRQELSGAPPYRVFLGNAPGVRVEFAGRAVDITPFTKDNATARFVLPPDATGGP